jgi:hypothetical protein
MSNAKKLLNLLEIKSRANCYVTSDVIFHKCSLTDKGRCVIRFDDVKRVELVLLFLKIIGISRYKKRRGRETMITIHEEVASELAPSFVTTFTESTVIL